MKNDKTIKKLTIGKNITTIGSNAFNGYKNLKNIVIRTKKLASNKIGKNAFKGIKSNATVTVPNGMMNKYKNVLDKIL